MKYLLILISTLSLGVVLGQRPIFSTAKVAKATLYLNSAELTHTATVTVQKGTNEIVVKNIANQLDENSVRVASNKPITILSAGFSNSYYSEYEIDENSTVLKKVQDSIDLVSKKLNGVTNTISANQQTIVLLDKNQTVGGENSGINALEYAKVVDYYRQKRIDLSNQIYDLQQEQTKLGNILKRLRNQLTFQEGEEDKESNGKVVLQVMSDVAQTISFEISYITNQAYWAPFYELEAINVDKPLHLTSKGKVIQTTGVDWKQVRLTLSSTQPNPNNEIPYFSQWLLSFSNYHTGYSAPPPANAAVTYSAKKAEMQAKEDAGSQYNMEQTIADYTTTDVRQLSVNYVISIPYDIYANGKPHTVTFAEQNVPASYNYYAAPKLNKDAYLIANVHDYSQYNLLPGEANITFEGKFVGKTFLNPSTTNDTLQIALGVDPNVVIKREKVAEKSGNKVLSGNREATFTFDISVRNNKTASINLTLKDQFPISKDKEVIVELSENSNATLNDEVGTFTWELRVKPQETKKVRFGYKVKYPKDKTIYNL